MPETRYARSGDVNIAYQISGEGPFDLVFIPGYVTHLELHWSIPSFVPFLERLSSFARLIRFDKRGTGMSDRVSGAPTLETRMDDVRAELGRGAGTHRHLAGGADQTPAREEARRAASAGRRATAGDGRIRKLARAATGERNRSPRS